MRFGNSQPLWILGDAAVDTGCLEAGGVGQLVNLLIGLYSKLAGWRDDNGFCDVILRVFLRGLLRGGDDDGADAWDTKSQGFAGAGFSNTNDIAIGEEKGPRCGLDGCWGFEIGEGRGC